MSSRNRVVLIAVTLAAMVALFIVLQPTGSDEETTTTAASQTSSAPTSTATTPVAPAATTSTQTTPTTTAAAPPPKPAAKRIAVKGLKPVGGVEDLEFDKGETIRFVVTSDQAENVHLHGYDVERDVGPGKSARFSVKADIEGIFEVELENSAVPIAELTVNP